MSQTNVERVIGRLVTDEAFRRRFAAGREELLRELVAQGLELNWCELEVLGELDLRALARFAERIDPRIHKSDLGCPELAKRLRNPRSALRRGKVD
jgi:hypothetical protein